ncbi:MAG: hypothetical protein ABIM21_06740 [candidate division WOR-3 bacterium]|uniref:hypothetical protein n=1 Tax=Saccharolobus sp. TaxID=2100761 RepID=UPI0031784E19
MLPAKFIKLALTVLILASVIIAMIGIISGPYLASIYSWPIWIITGIILLILGKKIDELRSESKSGFSER